MNERIALISLIATVLLISGISIYAIQVFQAASQPTILLTVPEQTYHLAPSGAEPTAATSKMEPSVL